MYHRSSYIPMISPWYFLWLAWNIISPKPWCYLLISRRPKRCHPHRWSSTVIWLCPCLGWAKDGRKAAKRIFSTSFIYIYIYIYIGYVIIFTLYIKKNGMSFFSILFHVENDDIATSKRVLFGLWHPVFGASPLTKVRAWSVSLDIKKQRSYSDAGWPSKYNHISISIHIYIYVLYIDIYVLYIDIYVLYIDIVYCI